jgi:3'(2'), 5'-bisphosphate nucleotidase
MPIWPAPTRRALVGLPRRSEDLVVDPVRDDHDLAERLAREAGTVLFELRERLASKGRSRYHIEQSGDVAGHDFLVEELSNARPADTVLSEEGHDPRHRLDSERVWIVDPLDGSSDYGQHHSAEWAVHVALVEAGRASAAAVALPALDVVYGTGRPHTVPDRGDRRPIVVAGRSRVHYDGVLVAEALDADLATCGSAGVKAMTVVRGETDVYIHAGPLYEWDACAPAGVALSSGLHVSGADGSELVFNQSRPVVPGLLICQPEFAEPVVAALAAG